MNHFSGIEFLGALAIFMYGIRLSRSGIQLAAGDKLRSLVSHLTENRFMAMITGILMTLILQSSTATTTMLVSFASSGSIPLQQAMGVILGADIGTTAVVFLLSVKEFSEYALLLLVLGVSLDVMARKKKTSYLSMIFMGFGFVFLGMQLMIHATIPLRESPLLIQIFSSLGQNPISAFLAAIILTVLVQNSATTLGITMALAFSGVLNLEQSLPIVLGANVGTCSGSLIQSISGNIHSKRVAFSHLFFKLTGALVALFLLSPFTHLLQSIINHIPSLQNQPARQVAFSHVLFNLALSCFFLPFTTLGAKLIQKIVPETQNPDADIFKPKYLDSKSLQTPALAFANAKREILRMSEFSYDLLKRVIIIFEKDDHSLIEDLQEEDDKIDILDREIKLYLAKISQENLTPDQAKLQLNLVSITSDLEEIGDIINRHILSLGGKRMKHHQHFSKEGGEEIRDIHSKIIENFEFVISLLTTENEQIARKIIRHEQYLETLETKFRESHLQRLQRGMKESIETSSIHLDLLSNFRRINSKLTAIAKLCFLYDFQNSKNKDLGNE